MENALPISIYKRVLLLKGILFGEGMSGELSSVGGCKKKKMHLFS